MVTRIDCADQFIVKSWNARNPNDYQMSDLLPITQFSYTVTDLVPNQNYVFQAVARCSGGQGHPGERLEQVTTRPLQDNQLQSYSCPETG